MTNEEQQKIIDAINQAKTLDPKLSYLLVVKKHNTPNSVIENLSMLLNDEWGMRVAIVTTHEEPSAAIALYKLIPPEQPE